MVNMFLWFSPSKSEVFLLKSGVILLYFTAEFITYYFFAVQSASSYLSEKNLYNTVCIYFTLVVVVWRDWRASNNDSFMDQDTHYKERDPIDPVRGRAFLKIT